jgi:hypothetical protein
MNIKAIAYRFVPQPLMNELRHREHLRDLATAVEPEEAEVRQVVVIATWKQTLAR